MTNWEYDYVVVDAEQYPEVLRAYSRTGWRLHTVWHDGSMVHTTWEHEIE